jgi:hypothetical protein
MREHIALPSGNAQRPAHCLVQAERKDDIVAPETRDKIGIVAQQLNRVRTCGIVGFSIMPYVLSFVIYAGSRARNGMATTSARLLV